MKLNAMSTPLGQKVFAALPDKCRCRRCHKPRAKAEFGLRVMAKDANGKPVRIARQSWCGRCRANKRY